MDLSGCTALQVFYCYKNFLSALDLSQNTALQLLQCSNNRLITLDISHNKALKDLMCSDMNDENGNNLLQTLYLYKEQKIADINVHRSAHNLPAETKIVYLPAPF